MTNLQQSTGLKTIEVWHALYDLEVRFWHEVNVNAGKRAHEMYTDKGLLVVGDRRHEGRDSIQQFYGWRAQRGARISRHLISNFQVESVADNKAKAVGLVSVFAADGVPVLPSRPATMIADLQSECTLCEDGVWRFDLHVVKPLFRGEGRLT